MSYRTDPPDTTSETEATWKLLLLFLGDLLTSAVRLFALPALLSPVVASGLSSMYRAEAIGAAPPPLRPLVAELLGPFFLVAAFVGVLYLMMSY